ncbi:uncharacterized protein O3C94_018920 [Discoglossus pictus]
MGTGLDSLREIILNFSLDKCKPYGNQGYDRVLLQLFGYLGHGKSSFINTCKYVLKEGEFRTYADVGHSDGGKTTCRITYPLTNDICLVDNRGCAKMDSYETGEIFAQLGNLLPLDKEVEWHTGYQSIMKRLVESDMDANYSDIVVPIFVYSVKNGITNEEYPEIKNLLDIAKKMTGLISFVVLTHKSLGHLTDVEAKFRDMGINHIFNLDNYTPTDNSEIRKSHENVLNFICEVLKDVTFLMEKKRNPISERADRKKFILNFAHERDLMREEERREREVRINEKIPKNKVAGAGAGTGEGAGVGTGAGTGTGGCYLQ